HSELSEKRLRVKLSTVAGKRHARFRNDDSHRAAMAVMRRRPVGSAVRRFTTLSQVILAATPWPRSPNDAASAGSAASRLMAAAGAAGGGSQTYPFTPSTTNSSVPPESRAVITGLRERNASSVTYP